MSGSETPRPESEHPRSSDNLPYVAGRGGRDWGPALAVILFLLTLLVWLLSGGFAHAQATDKDPAQPAAAAESIWSHVQFGGTFEGYYQFNWNRPSDRVIPLRAYDTRSNSFSLQQ